MERADVVILGAGAAGMMCAIEAGRRGRRVVLIDHAAAPGEKIRISGGRSLQFHKRQRQPGELSVAKPAFLRLSLEALSARRFHRQGRPRRHRLA